MKRMISILSLGMALAGAAGFLRAQEVIDRIAARVEGEVILLSEIQELARPAIQVSDQAIDDFYKKRVVPRAESRGQTAPTMEAAREYIQEALVQRAINEQADKWLKESRPRLRVENLLAEKAQ
jgi:hypothetical protein